MADTTSDAGFALPKFILRAPTLWAGLLMIALIFIMAAAKGSLGDIGQDNDDVMRLVQIRDYLLGQGWFDTNQYRLGLAGGTDMHWSRIPDIPLIILTHIFDLFTTQETALQISYTVWPPLSALVLIFAMTTGAKFWAAQYGINPKATYGFTLVLLAFFVLNFYRFTPGAIDHHNVQMGLVAWAVVLLLDPKRRFWTFAASGAAVATSLAVGVEVYIFAAIICAFVALNWMVLGASARAGTQGFGLGLCAGLVVCFFGTIAPSEYGVVACDALSLITLSAALVGGLGLASLASGLSARSLMLRFMGLGVLGVACVLVLSFQAPQCLNNPLNVLPDVVDRLWLSNISEAKGLSLGMKNAAMEIPYMLGAPLLALGMLIVAIWKNRRWGGTVLILMLLLGALGLTIYQQRFFPFAYVVSILPLAGWIAKTYQAGVGKLAAHDDASDTPKPSNIAYIGALALSVPLIWAVPGILMSEADNAATEASKATACYSSSVMDALNTLPTGVIAATSNGGAPILNATKHRSISGNYHRNITGIALQINIGTSTPDVAKSLLKDNDIDYLHFCRPTAETQNLIDENPDGLYGVLKQGIVPDYLTPAVDDLEDGDVTIYKVVR
ncbi:hypothetical protein [Fretibacter rubidus]|uniref:hypothetical protein n=1 Tax=Fretibacter rubidus TaxID=570162 RepID=UPI00352AC0F3